MSSVSLNSNNPQLNRELVKLFQCLRDADAAAFASNHSSQCVLDALLALHLLTTDADQSCIDIVKTATN